MINHERSIEAIEILKKLEHSSFKSLIFAVINEPKCLTSSGKMNISATARYLHMNTTQVISLLKQLKDHEGRLFG